MMIYFAESFKKLRLKKGLTQEQAADRSEERRVGKEC